MNKKLYKSATDKKIAGVCGGLAVYLGIDATIIRLIFVFAVVFFGTGGLAYLIAAIVIPKEPVYNNQGYTNPGYNNQGYNNQGCNNGGYNNQGYNNQGYTPYTDAGNGNNNNNN